MKISKIKKKRRSSRNACARRQFNKTRQWVVPKNYLPPISLSHIKAFQQELEG